MTAKKLIGMAAVLVLLVGIAVVQKKKDVSRHSPPARTDATLLEGIDLNAITQLEITQSSTGRVALIKKDGQWTVDSLYGYPADFSQLANALRTMADVKPGSPMRAANVTASEFGLDDSAKRIVLKTGDNRTAATVVIGEQRKGSAASDWKNQSFIRKDQEEAVYLVAYDFDLFSEKSTDWISRSLLQVPPDDIVSVKAGDVVLKKNGADWTLPDLNKETEEFQSPEADRMRSVLEELGCITVADPAKTDKELGFDKPFTYVAQTKDGFTYTIKLGAKTDVGQFARFAVDYTRPAPPVAPAGDDAEKKKAYDKELEAFNSTVAANADKADALNARLSKWTPLISTYAAECLQLPRVNIAPTKGTEPAENPADTLE